MTREHPDSLPQHMLYGPARGIMPPEHLGYMPPLPDDAASEAASTSEALAAASALAELDAASAAVASRHGEQGMLALWGILGAAEAVASSHIEGEGTSLKWDDMTYAVRDMLLPCTSDGLVVTNADIDFDAWNGGEMRSVLQCAGATKHMLAFGLGQPEVLRAHAILARGQRHAKPGECRSNGDDVIIGDSLGNVAFAPPLGGEDIAAMLLELVAWTQARIAEIAALEDTTERYAAAAAVSGIAHLRFESIHPFCDGNGRTGRSFAETVIAAARPRSYVVLPVGIATAFCEPIPRSGYYAALDHGRDDQTGFAVWWCEQIQQAAEIALPRTALE